MPITAADVLVQALMTSASGLPEDTVVNTWAFRLDVGGAPSAAALDDLAQHVGDFYRLGLLLDDQVGSYISSAVDRGATHEIQIFSILSGGSPIHSSPWLGPVSPGAGFNLPTEVAGVLSFHGNLTGVLEESGLTRPRARRRGRVFIGPLNGRAITNDPLPLASPGFTLAMRANANEMRNNAKDDGWTWSVWSRTNAELYPVTAGWTDNALDTQRRRGNSPTSRVTFLV